MKNVAICFTILVIHFLSATTTGHFLDMVSLRCLDKTLTGKTMKESELKPLAAAAAEEILQTLEFLEGQHYYQVAVALAGSGADGYCNTQRNHTGKKAPSTDVTLFKFYPLGQFSAYVYIYAADRK